MMTHTFKWICIACLAFWLGCITCAMARAELKLKAHTDVSIKFFKGSQIFVYEVTESELAIEFSLCGGWNEGIKVTGVGAETGINACFDWKVSVPVAKKARDKAAVLKLLKEYLAKGGSKDDVAKQLRMKLSKASDSELKDVGISRKQIDDIKGMDIEFGPLNDSTDDPKKVRDVIDKCPQIPSRLQPNS